MDRKKILYVSLDGLISDIAWQTVKEGHEVKYFIESEGEREIADGFVPKVPDWADVIVFDDVLGQGQKAQALRQRGKLVVGGSPYTDWLEDDRAFGQQELQVLEDYKRAWAERIKDFQLQRRIVGVEVAPCGRPSARPTTASRTS